jgi:peptidyl-prolyl cis-trans isomerase A (cyclophilin A)
VIHSNEFDSSIFNGRAMRIAILCFVLAGCGRVEHENARHGANRQEATTGVAEDGTQIVFAGTHTAPASEHPSYDDSRLRREPNTPDPESGNFTLEEAVVGMPVDGTLVAEIGTDFGTLLCDLYADRAPRTVANFVGLTRGLRPWWDARAGEWVRRAYYRGLTFHRVIPGYLIQGGDYLGDGTGSVGYRLRDEPNETLSHDRAGQLCMANQDGANSAGAQFFLTDGAAPQLDRDPGSTIFGQCQPLDLIAEIARVPQDSRHGNRPLTAIQITRLSIRRVEGGAAAAQPTAPRQPPGEPAEPRAASPDPMHLHSRHGEPYPPASPMPPGLTGPPSPPLPTPTHPPR